MAANFDFQKRLGAGQFGEVWLAIDTGLNVVRAVKLIPPDKVLDQKNFFHEAQILKAIEHPNVVRVEETGKFTDGRIYVAMEYLPKGSLDDEASGAYVDLSRAKRVMIDVLRGLEHAHSKTILHRDIKPANILISDTLDGKLSDFGQAIPAGTNLKTLGVKDYVYIIHQAPEIYSGAEYSFVSDVYGCGVTLYRLVNGDSYLPHLDFIEIRRRVINGTFPGRTHYREFVPRPLKMIINKAMNVDPAKRFQSAQEMRRALEQIIVEKNWRETVLSDGVKWTCGWNQRCYEVTRSMDETKKWRIIVKKGKSKKTLRRLNEVSVKGLSKAKAKQITQRILQDFVLGRKM